ncbi:Uncharacterised protein [Streptococcus pneumoniae]|nr:Uncharacterised protein [Streptococcus pneumoniae]
MVPEELAQRGGLVHLELLHLLEDRGLLHGLADQVADDDQHHGDQERDAPAPGEELLLGHGGAHDEQHAGGQDHAQRHADLRGGAEQAALAVGGVLHGQQRRAAPLAAGGQALQQAQRDEQDRGPHADLGVGGQQADEGGGQAHADQREGQHELAAEAVAEVAGDDRAERADEEGDAEGDPCGDLGAALAHRLEEEGGEDECGGLGEDEEVVPLDGGADDGAGDDLALLAAIARGGGRRGGCDGVAHGCSWDAGRRPAVRRRRDGVVPDRSVGK